MSQQNRAAGMCFRGRNVIINRHAVGIAVSAFACSDAEKAIEREIVRIKTALDRMESEAKHGKPQGG